MLLFPCAKFVLRDPTVSVRYVLVTAIQQKEVYDVLKHNALHTTVLDKPDLRERFLLAFIFFL